MNVPLILDVGDLQALLDTDSASDGPVLKLLDLRSADSYLAGHIPGARHLDSRLLNQASPPFAGLLPDEQGIHALIEAADLRKTDHVVAIDAGATTAAARLLWVLHAWGFTTTSWLNGGMTAWQASGAAMHVETLAADEASDAGPLYQPQLLADNRASADELLAELDDPALRVLDVRGLEEYHGRDVRSAEGGHVPGARHMEWTSLLQDDGRLKSREHLLAALQALDVVPEHRVVAYCQSHQRSAVTWLVLLSLGYSHVRGLDGAWSVWGNRPELPKA